MIWDDATIKRMKKHWENGLTGSQIAKLFGTTRSAVLGKARRMGLQSRNAKHDVPIVCTQPETRYIGPRKAKT